MLGVRLERNSISWNCVFFILSAVLLIATVFLLSCVSGDADDTDDDDSDDDAEGYVEVNPAHGVVHNPFGSVTAEVIAWDSADDIETIKLRAKGAPPDIFIQFKPSVAPFKSGIRSEMTIYGRMAAEEVYTFWIVAEWTDKHNQRWEREAQYTLDVVTDFDPAELSSWTKNSSFDKSTGLWETRTFCWTIESGCEIQPKPNTADWIGDGEVYLYAEDDNRKDFGCDCAAVTQGADKLNPDRVFGTRLDPVRTGDVRHAFIIFERSNFGTGFTPLIGAAGNIINLWITHPSGDYFGFDFYFETEGINNWFFFGGERLWHPDSRSCVYSLHLFEHPEYWAKTETDKGTERWIINLKAIIDRASEYTGWNLDDFEWRYVEPICESFALASNAPASAWQHVNYFEIKVALTGD